MVPPLQLGELRLDVENRRLLRGAEPIAVEPKVLECIALLAGARGELVSVAQLSQALWPETRVAPSALRRIIFLARKAVGDSGSAQRLIATDKRVGYRYVGAVAQLRAQLVSDATQGGAEPPRALPTLAQLSDGALRVGPYVLDRATRTLLRDATIVPVEPKVLDCIELLLRNAGRLVTLEQLRGALWADLRVSPAALRRVIDKARRALGQRDAGVRIVSRKGLGYVLEAPCQTARQNTASSPRALEAPPDHEPGSCLDDVSSPQQTRAGLEQDAREALALCDYPRAVRLLRRALELAERTSNELVARAELSLSLARASWYADDDPAEVRAAYRAAAALARDAGNAELFARAAVGCAVGEDSALALSDARRRQESEAALLDEALARLPETDDVSRHRVARTLCWMRGAFGEREPALAAARVALRCAPTPGDATDRVITLGIACMTAVWEADVAQAAGQLARLKRVCRSAKLAPGPRIEAYFQALTLSLALGDRATFRQGRAALAELATQLAEPPRQGRLGQRYAIYKLADAFLGVTLAVIDGEFAQAERQLGDLTALSRQLGVEGSGDASVAFLMLMPLFAYQGRCAQLEALLASIPTLPDPLTRDAAELRFALERGEHERATACFAQLRAQRFGAPGPGRSRTAQIDLLVVVADACEQVGTPADAAALYERLLPWSDFCAHDGLFASLGSVARPLGALAHQLGRMDESEVWLRKALRINLRFGHRPEQVRTRVALARTLGPTAESRSLLAAARKEATSMGLAQPT